jgi:hypothetical protein
MNRDALHQIDNWIPKGLLANSVFRYGINPDVEKVIDLSVDKEVTHADLLAYFGRTQSKPCRYLELGVSVGKSLWQIMQTCAPCECWAFDIEEINPALRQNLIQLSREEFPTASTSIKKSPSSITRFEHSVSGSTLSYVCADIFDKKAWKFLSGQQFNLVLSDALHTPEALSFEWDQITELGILDGNEVTIVWDDLDGPMHDWFEANRPFIARFLNVGVDQVQTTFVNGWLGLREPLHRLGIAIKALPKPLDEK